MKTNLFLLLLLLFCSCLCARAASPSFQDFDGSQFGTNGNKVRLKSGVVLTNPLVGLGVITGDGGGLTNLASATNFPAGPTYVFHGKVTISNLFVSSLNLSTNLGGFTTLFLNGGYQDLSTNNNVLFTGFSFLSGTGTSNVAWTTVVLTNTSGSLKTIGFPAGCIGDTNIYVTNQSAFTVLAYPGKGTMIVGRSLN